MDDNGSKIRFKKIMLRNVKYKENELEVYIVLTQTRTYFARLIKLYTREPYAHASIAFDADLDEMYSFGRKKVNNPFITGFIKEEIDSGVFGKYVGTACSVYSLKVTREQYERLKEEVEIFKANKEKYSYNFLGILGVMVNIPVNMENRYFCSQFIAYILERSGINLFNKSYGLVRPFDIRICTKLKKVYKGKLINYRTQKNDILSEQTI